MYAGAELPAPTGKAALHRRDFRNKTIPVCVSPPGAARAGLRSPGWRVQATMVFRDLMGDVLRTLWVHKLRTFLTMFGIAWGIVSIVLMVAAGEGLRKGQEEQARTFGKDVMIVFHGRTSMQAGGLRAGRLVQWQDSEIAPLGADSSDCEYVIPELEQDTVRAHSNFNNAAFTVTGSYPPVAYIRSLPVGNGRSFDLADGHEARRVAFVGDRKSTRLNSSHSQI